MTPLPDKVKGDLDIFKEYMSKDYSTYNASYAQQGFFVAVQTADMLRQVSADPLTAKAVHDGLGQTKGNAFFLTNTYDCSKPTWPKTTSCLSGFLYTTIDAASKTRPLLPDQPVDVSPVLPS